MSLTTKLAEERRARLAAERLLELKQAELFAANRKLGRHAEKLSEQINETRAEVASVRDENARVKSDLTAANEKIRIAERRLWHSIETMQDGFALFDDNDQLIVANPAYLSVFEGLEEVESGITYPRLLQLATEEGLIDPGDETGSDWRARMMDRWQSRNPEPQVIRLWNGRFIRLVDRRGENGGDVVSLALDITKTVRYEKRLRLARRKAEAASHAKSAFLANMSHEIRTPMNGVVGMAELLQGTELTEEQQLYIDTIRNSGEALLTIINDVLDYSKIEADKIVLREEEFDLEYILHEVAMLLQPSAGEKGIELSVDYDLFLPTRFRGDGGRLRQVMTNLMGNAVKFTTEGWVKVQVVGMHGGETVDLKVVVEDTGIGIPPEKLDHIFGEFNQVEDDRNRSFEGTGLGLAISKRLVRMMGGDLWVTSEADKGSCFGLSLSLPTDEPEYPGPTAVPAWVKKVLLVEGGGTRKTMVSRMLQALGKEVVSVASASEAASQWPWDVALLANGDMVPVFEAMAANGLSAPFLVLGAENHLRRRLLADLSGLGTPPAQAPARGTADAPLDVLLAEDNKTNQLVFSKMLKDAPVTVRFANNGLEAVEAVAERRPDIVFMDISMPKMDGKEATTKIREDGFDDLPVIAVTAHAMDGDDADILKAGLTDYMTKPVRKAALHAMLEKYAPGIELSGS